MDANIKNLRDALEWLDRSIREEADLDGEMTATHASRLGFIQSMLEKFPLRNCDLYATADEAMDAFDKFGCPNDCGDCPYADDGEGEMAKYCQVNWLFATAAQEGGQP